MSTSSSHSQLMENAKLSMPSLASAIEQLDLILSAKHHPPCVFIYAPNHGHLVADLVRHRLSSRTPADIDLNRAEPPSVQSLLPKSVFLDLRELQSPRQLYDRVLNVLSAWTSNNLSSGTVASATHSHATSEVWNGRLKGLKVVRSRRRVESDGMERASKRARLEQDESDIAVEKTECDVEDEGDWSLEWDRSLPTVTLSGVQHDRRNESLDSFRQGLSEIFALGGTSVEPKQRRFVVLEHGELLGDLPSGGPSGLYSKEINLDVTFASVMMYLDEALKSDEHITTIIISTRSWTKERAGMVGLRDPELVSFPSLQHQDIVNILCARFDGHPLPSHALGQPTLSALFRSLASLVHSTFNSQVGTHLDEVAYLVAKFWPIWLGLVQSNQVQAGDIARLGSHLKEDLSREIDRIANSRPPIVSSSSSLIPSTSASSAPRGFTGTFADPLPIASSSSASVGSTSNLSLTPIRHLSHEMVRSIVPSPSKQTATASDTSLAASLPTLAKYLLISSFLASFNPPKLDRTYFVKVDERVSKKGKKPNKAAVKKPGTATLKAPITSGPKTYPIERLLAILEAILPKQQEYASQSIDVLMQITSLINLRLITRSSVQDRLLDNVKLKSNVTRETIDMLAKTVKFGNWTEYLHKAED